MKEHITNVVEMYLPDEITHFEECYPDEELHDDVEDAIKILVRKGMTDHIVYDLLMLKRYASQIDSNV